MKFWKCYTCRNLILGHKVAITRRHETSTWIVYLASTQEPYDVREPVIIATGMSVRIR
ncbi:hypothetical protein HanRHA438_Chr01g0002961 [Helianthus annuus]|nr:hypothetical protein HanRHA438_Chr01g0002961 [Helianthus annuus]